MFIRALPPPAAAPQVHLQIISLEDNRKKIMEDGWGNLLRIPQNVQRWWLFPAETLRRRPRRRSRCSDKHLWVLGPLRRPKGRAWGRITHAHMLLEAHLDSVFHGDSCVWCIFDHLRALSRSAAQSVTSVIHHGRFMTMWWKKGEKGRTVVVLIQVLIKGIDPVRVGV